MGELFEADLFLDFEDWRMGARAFSFEGNSAPIKNGTSIRGAHFSPFDSTPLGPDIPCYLIERNQGLVLDRQLQSNQIFWQQALVDDLHGRIKWITENIEWAVMGPKYRSRKDVKERLSYVRWDYNHWLDNEIRELFQLNSSQCSFKKCTIKFNTSSLELTGAITGTGILVYIFKHVLRLLFSIIY